jgi:eukaryotic-like serine/threonine-protein kinase
MVEIKDLTEGLSLGGVYTLGAFLRQDRKGTFFVVSTKDGERLLIKLMPEQAPESERQFARWQRSHDLHHPHLLELRDLGRTELAGTRYIFAVFEYPDDLLSSAVEHGPLSESETRGVLEAALAGLRYLHGQGMVHGAVGPEQIVAVGETVKLATDGLRDSDEPEAQAEDVRQLGELVRSLRAPEPLGEPLAAIVRHATAKPQNRWTLAEIGAALGPAAGAATIPAGEADGPRSGAFPKWIFAGVAILLLAILYFNLRRKSDTPPTVSHVAAPDRAPVARITPQAAAPPAAAPSVAAPSAAAPPPATPVPAPPAAPARSEATAQSPVVWRVIAFTYRSREIATKKANQINERWPDLRAVVFAPRELRGYYLVALGDPMTREEATRLQRKARGMGLPRDTFIQNYSE